MSSDIDDSNYGEILTNETTANTLSVQDDNSNKNEDDSTLQKSHESTKTGILKKLIFGKDEDVPNIKVTFHVHLPSFDHVEGYPIIVGNIEELGNWEEPIVKLNQKKSERMHSQSSYWYSDPISIPIERFNNCEVKYNYAFFVPKPKPEEKSIFSKFKREDKNKDKEKDKDKDEKDKDKKDKDEENKDKSEKDKSEKNDNLMSKWSKKLIEGVLSPLSNENNDSQNNDDKIS